MAAAALGVAPERAVLPVGVVGTFSATLANESPAVSGQGDEDIAIRVAQVGHPQVAEGVPGKLLVAADLPQCPPVPVT